MVRVMSTNLLKIFAVMKRLERVGLCEGLRALGIRGEFW